MHKKKNSASVLGGEMILTFYKPPEKQVAETIPISPSVSAEQVLGDVIDELLPQDDTAFTHEYLFNQLIIELWNRNALGCLELDRDIFIAALEDRGCTYDVHTHEWVRRAKDTPARSSSSLF